MRCETVKIMLSNCFWETPLWTYKPLTIVNNVLIINYLFVVRGIAVVSTWVATVRRKTRQLWQLSGTTCSVRGVQARDANDFKTTVRNEHSSMLSTGKSSWRQKLPISEKPIVKAPSQVLGIASLSGLFRFAIGQRASDRTHLFLTVAPTETVTRPLGLLLCVFRDVTPWINHDVCVKSQSAGLHFHNNTMTWRQKRSHNRIN